MLNRNGFTFMDTQGLRLIFLKKKLPNVYIHEYIGFGLFGLYLPQQQPRSYFIGEGNRSTRRKTPTYSK